MFPCKKYLSDLVTYLLLKPLVGKSASTLALVALKKISRCSLYGLRRGITWKFLKWPFLDPLILYFFKAVYMERLFLEKKVKICMNLGHFSLKNSFLGGLVSVYLIVASATKKKSLLLSIGVHYKQKFCAKQALPF